MKVFDNLTFEAEAQSKKELRSRKGCIRITHQLHDVLSLEDLKLFHSNFYVINVDRIEFGDYLYFGFSEHFDISIEGEKMEYYAIFSTHKNKPKTIEFKKI